MFVEQNGTQWNTRKGSFHLPGGFGTQFVPDAGRNSHKSLAESGACNTLQHFATQIKRCYECRDATGSHSRSLVFALLIAMHPPYGDS